MHINGNNGTGYNGTWLVTDVDTNGTWFKANVGDGTLDSGTGGMAGRLGLSCGESSPANGDPGALSYDTAAYWMPSAWTGTGGATFQPAVRQRVYYVGYPGSLGCGGATDPPCVSQLPEGWGIIGGNSSATDPLGNPHIYWTCGHKSGQTNGPNPRPIIDITPVINHPYDCDQFWKLSQPPNLDQTWSFVDGPVGMVDLGRCFQGSLRPPSQSPDLLTPAPVFPNEDGGADDTICDGDYGTTLPEISIRTHIGQINGSRSPCRATCLAYVISKLHKHDCSLPPPPSAATCKADVTVAGQNTNYTNDYFGPTVADMGAGATVDVFGYIYDPANFQSLQHYPVESYSASNPYTFTISGFPYVLPDCDAVNSIPYCGSVAQTLSQPLDTCDPANEDVRFSLAGGPAGDTDTCHGYWTLHADFWDTWNQSALIPLVQDCLDGGMPTGGTPCFPNSATGQVEADIEDNHQADCIAATSTTSCP